VNDIPDGERDWTPSPLTRIDAVCDRFEGAWQAGGKPRLEEFLAQAPVEDRAGLLRELLKQDIVYRRRAGDPPTPEEYRARLPEYADLIEDVFAALAGGPAQRPPGPPAREAVTQPPAPAPLEAAVESPTSGAGAPPWVPGYEILGELGRGGMGVVYQARQKGLKRVIALKMILAGAHAGPQDLARFRTEAEAIARLQHPNIIQIHEVGEQDGLPYFSMEFCSGGSLAARLQGTPLPPRDAARLGEALARAMHAAHQAQVVHRDLKPANVLLQRKSDLPHPKPAPAGAEGAFRLDDYEPKVTDFGLARKLDEAGQTASGALLGTPEYMAPEQAAGKTKEVGPAADVYALGALLYECLTGRPPFRAATVLDTVLQVLEAEPAPPRLLNPGVSRDLETIILKCLAKEPARRYANALALAEDLRRFLAGEPIRARRPGMAERAVRWARRHSRSVLRVGGVEAALIALLAAGLLAWQWYREGLLGRVILTSADGLAMEAEVFGPDGAPALEPFTIPTRQPVALPAGTYRVRVSAPWRLSETYEMVVERGVQRKVAVDLNERRLWEPLAVPRGCEVIDLGGRGAAVVLVSDRGLRLVDGKTGKDLWPGGERSLAAKDQPALAKWANYDWDRIRKEWPNPGQKGEGQSARSIQPPYLVRPAPALGGDGGGDLVWVSRNGAWLLAVSGKDGSVRWWSPGVSGYPDSLACPPVVADVDGDGTPDVVAVFGWQTGGKYNLVVQAVSGRTGKQLWNPRRLEARESQGHPYAAALLNEGGRQVLAVVHKTSVTKLDLGTGEVVLQGVEQGEPFTYYLGPPVVADLAGKGRPGVLVHRRCELWDEGRFEDSLIAVSLLTGKELWKRTSLARPERVPPPAVAADLDGRGEVAVVCPTELPIGPGRYVPGLECLDGATGKTIWQKPLSVTSPLSLAPCVVGPDLNGDGQRDLFTAALVRDDPDWRDSPEVSRVAYLLVAAVSGADGRILWRYLEPVSGSDRHEFQTVELTASRQPGAVGAPRLVVTYSGLPFSRIRGVPKGEPVTRTFLFSADGKVEHTCEGFLAVGLADLDGDGIPDVYALGPDRVGGPVKLHAFRGLPPERWRRLGLWQPDIGNTIPVADAEPPAVAAALPAGTFALPGEEPSLSRALPWEATARRSALRGWLPALVCALLWGYWVWRRQWARVAALPVAFVGVAVAVAEWELAQSRMSFRQGLPLHAFALLLVLLYLSASVFRWWHTRRSRARWKNGRRLIVLCLLLVIIAIPLLWRRDLWDIVWGIYLPDAVGSGRVYLPVSWGGWYWIGPYVLSAAGTLGFGALLIWLAGWYLFIRTTPLLRKPRGA
jgi:hypothetical protein